MAKKGKGKLTNQQKKFCERYLLDWNATKAYQHAYRSSSESAARSSASALLTNPNIQEYISEIQKDLEKVSGISRLKVLKEFEKLAFNTMADLHNTWIDRKEFEHLTSDQKACISEIQTRVLKRNIGTKDNPDIVDVEEIKIKLYDKTKALENICRMLGYNEPEKHDVQIGQMITVVSNGNKIDLSE